MIKTLRTDSTNSDFQKLVEKLDAYLAEIDGEETAFYSQYNKIDSLKNVVVIFENEKAVACGAFKKLNENSVEIKRMYTEKSARGKGFARKVLSELEVWAKEVGFESCVLETGKRQPDAVALYHKCGYQVIPNYGQYKGVENSLCFEKKI